MWLVEVQIFLDFIADLAARPSDRPLVGIQAFNFDYIDLSESEEECIRPIWTTFLSGFDGTREYRSGGLLKLILRRQNRNKVPHWRWSHGCLSSKRGK